MLALVCMTQQELLLHDMSRDCKAGCKNQGYDSGALQKERCVCVDFYSYEQLTKKKFKITSHLLNKSTVIHENSHENATTILELPSPSIEF